MRFQMRFQTIGMAAALAALACVAYGCSTTVTATITPPNGCNTNAALNCVVGDGWTCTQGDNPEAEESGLSCSVPQTDQTNANEDDFCCIAWTSSSTTCTPDDDLTAQCQYPALGYQCLSGDNPVTLDSSLNCSVNTPDADGVHDDFCCE